MGDDSIGQYDYHEDPWRDIRGAGSAQYSVESTELGSKDTYPLPKFDSLSTSIEPFGPSKKSFQIDHLATPPPVPQVMTTGTVAVYVGLDEKGGPAVIERAPHEMFQYVPEWLTSQLRRQEEIKKQAAFRSGASEPVSPGSAGWLAVLGRLVTGPIARMTRLLQQLGTRFFDSFVLPAARMIARPVVAVAVALGRFLGKVAEKLWAPIEWTLIRVGGFIDRQYQRVAPYLKKGLEQALGFGKRVLDTLILEAPRTAWAVFKGLPARLSNWLSGFTDRNPSR